MDTAFFLSFFCTRVLERLGSWGYAIITIFVRVFRLEFGLLNICTGQKNANVEKKFERLNEQSYDIIKITLKKIK